MGSFQSKLQYLFEVQYRGFTFGLNANLEMTGSFSQLRRQMSERVTANGPSSPGRQLAASSPLFPTVTDRRHRTKCAVCNVAFHPPIKILRCGHSFCYRCLWRLRVAPYIDSDLLRCKLCLQITEVPRGDCNRLPTNVQLERLLEQLGILGSNDTPLMQSRTLEPWTGEEPSQWDTRAERESNGDPSDPTVPSPNEVQAIRRYFGQTSTDDTFACIRSSISTSQSTFEDENSSGPHQSMLPIEESSVSCQSLSVPMITSNGDGSSNSRTGMPV